MTHIDSWQSIGLLIVLLAITHIAARWASHRTTGARTPGEAGAGLQRQTLVIAAGLCALLFAALTLALLGGGFIEQIDHTIRSAVQILQDPAFVQLCHFITAMGDIETIVAVSLVTAGLLWAQGRRMAVAGLAVSVIGSQATTYIAKYTIGRERPQFEAFASAATPSYPSGHATAAVAVYGFVVYAIAHQLPPRRLRFEIIYWGTAFILAVATTRVILGVHFASDVIAGLLVGLFWLIMGCLLSRSANYDS